MRGCTAGMAGWNSALSQCASLHSLSTSLSVKLPAWLSSFLSVTCSSLLTVLSRSSRSFSTQDDRVAASGRIAGCPPSDTLTRRLKQWVSHVQSRCP